MRQRRKKCMRNAAAFLAPVVFILGLPAWFLFPVEVKPLQSDAVLVLAGAADGRHELGADLIGRGISQDFVVSNPSGSKARVGSAYCRGAKQPPKAKRVWCMRPDPVSTVGEAVTVGKMAESEGWTTLTVVTNRPHTHRVRTIFRECTGLDVTVVYVASIDREEMPYRVAREIGGYLKFWFTSPC